MWRLSKRDNNIENVDVRKVKDSDEDNVYAEISKYTSRILIILKGKKVFGFFYDALKGRQVITYNKILKN